MGSLGRVLCIPWYYLDTFKFTKDCLQVDKRQLHHGVCSGPTSNNLQGDMAEYFKKTCQRAQKSILDGDPKSVAFHNLRACQKPVLIPALLFWQWPFAQALLRALKSELKDF